MLVPLLLSLSSMLQFKDQNNHLVPQTGSPYFVQVHRQSLLHHFADYCWTRYICDPAQIVMIQLLDLVLCSNWTSKIAQSSLLLGLLSIFACETAFCGVSAHQIKLRSLHSDFQTMIKIDDSAKFLYCVLLNFSLKLLCPFELLQEFL